MTATFALRYLRRKPGRGMVARFGPDTTDPAGSVCITIDERSASGRVPDGDGGIRIDVFPLDRRLPALRACSEPEPGTAVFAALVDAARRAAGAESPWHLATARAQALRYKPGDRCVFRYWLQGGGPGARMQRLTLVGKMYAEPRRAAAAYARLQQLWERTRLVPRPLALVADAGLVLCADVETIAVAPGAMAEGAAAALAQLHGCGLPSSGEPVRAAAREAEQVVARAELLAAFAPPLAGSVRAAAGRVATALGELPDVHPRPAHGSFKPSQLLATAAGLVVVDIDSFCFADPALDVGYFLAYLQPPGLVRPQWRRQRAAMARRFLDGYVASGGDAPALRSRSAVYEAAVLFKIATRRVHRMNSPRPHELVRLAERTGALLEGCEGGRPL